jgi:hypothetical protein
VGLDRLALKLAADTVMVRYADGLMPSGSRVAARWPQHLKERLMLARFGAARESRRRLALDYLGSVCSWPEYRLAGRVRFIAWGVAMAILPAWLLRRIPGICGSSIRL